jgi:hypothetical protein
MYLLRHCSQSLSLLVELHAFRFIRLTTLTLKALLCAQFGIMLTLLLGLFLGHRLKGLLFTLLFATFIFGTLLSNSTTTSIVWCE